MYPNPNNPYGAPQQQQQQNVGWSPNSNQGSPYPPAGGNPPYPGASVPQLPGYPSGASPGYPPNQSPYPVTSPGYPLTTPQAPPSSYGGSFDSSFGSSSGYPSASPGYPPSPAGYPQQHGGGTPGYPQQHGLGTPGYPQQGQGTPGYPASSPGYPQVSPYGTPAPAGYPPASGNSPYPGAPGQGGYPPASGNSPYPGAPAPGGYPQGSPATGYPPSPHHTSSPYGAPAGGLTQTHAPSYHNTPTPQGHAASPYGQPQQGHGHGGHAPPTTVPATMQQYQDVPTIHPVQHDPTADANVLRKAMKGFGTDEAAIINVLAKRTNAQRLEISHAFKASFGKDLIKDLKSELGGKLEEVILAMMTPRLDYLASHLHKGISGLGTKEKSLVDILCTSTNQEVFHINQAYHRLYGSTLERDLKGDTSGHFRRLLVSMSVGRRDENPVANPQMAVADAKALYDAGVKKFGTDEATFNQVLCTRSYAQLRLMFHEYEKAYGHAFETAVDREFSGDVKVGLLAVVKCAKNRAAYFAERIHESVAGMGTKDDDLIFLIVTRAEIDLESVKQEYHRMYHKSCSAAVSGDTSGDYKKILLGLLGN